MLYLAYKTIWRNMLRHAKTESLPTEGQYRAYLRHLRFEKRQLGTTVAATLSKLSHYHKKLSGGITLR